MKHTLIILLVLLPCQWAAAQLAFISGNLYYEVTSADDRTVEVYGPAMSMADLMIPDTVGYQGVTYRVTSVRSQAFYDSDFLRSVHMGRCVEEINPAAFMACPNLSTLELDTALTDIWSGAFSYCTSLQEVVIPPHVAKLRNGTFMNCTALRRVHIPESVTWVDLLVFSGCTALTELELPESVNRLGNNVINGCTSLTTLTCHAATPPQWDGVPGTADLYRQVTVRVPTTSVDAYRAAPVWRDFARIEPLTGSATVHDADTNIGSTRVTLQGLPVASPGRGTIIITGGRKTLLR